MANQYTDTRTWGMNYAPRWYENYLIGKECKEVEALARDQARFNWAWLVYREEIEDKGMVAIPKSFAIATSEIIFSELRTALYSPPYNFLETWDRLVDKGAVFEEYMMPGKLPMDMWSRMRDNVEVVHTRLIGEIEGNLRSIDHFRRIKYGRVAA